MAQAAALAEWRGWEGEAPLPPGGVAARRWAVAGSVGLHAAALALMLVVFGREEAPQLAPVPVSITALPVGAGEAVAAPELEMADAAAPPAAQHEAVPDAVPAPDPAAMAQAVADARPDVVAREVPVPDVPAARPDVTAQGAPAEATSEAPVETARVAPAEDTRDVPTDTAEIALSEPEVVAEPPPTVQAAVPPPPPPPPPAPPVRAAVSPRPAPARPAPLPPARSQPMRQAQPGSGGATPAMPPGAPPAAAGDETPMVLTHASFRRPPTPPAYPARARELGMEGEVVVRCLLDRDGTPGSVTLARSSGHALLDQAALAAVRLWAFEPGRRGGVPVPAVIQIPVRFALR